MRGVTTEMAMLANTIEMPMTESNPLPSQMPFLGQMGTEKTWTNVAKPAIISDALTRSVMAMV